MLNTIDVKDNKSKILVNNLINNLYFLPDWEKIKTFSLFKTGFLFKKSSLKVNLFRKFSSRNMIEKYLIKTDDNTELGKMDLKIYKDSVYIINIDCVNNKNSEEIIKKFIQTAIEKSLYNTTEKEVKINLTSPNVIKGKIKKELLLNEFKTEENQTDYEKRIFGETFSYKFVKNSKWANRIKQMPILINE